MYGLVSAGSGHQEPVKSMAAAAEGVPKESAVLVDEALALLSESIFLLQTSNGSAGEGKCKLCLKRLLHVAAGFQEEYYLTQQTNKF